MVNRVPPNSHARQIHDAGDASAVFSFGNTLILKVKLTKGDAALREHKTLAFLSKQKLSFSIPTVLYHMEEPDRIYLFEPQMPGKSLNEAWWDMSAKEKEHVSSPVAHICSELRAFRTNVITGIDYNWMNSLREKRDDSPEALQKHCEELGMDCSTYVLSHNDLGPTNVLLDGDQIAVIDWDLAGYCPVEWVRTKFAVCRALDVESVTGDAGVKTDGEYRLLVERKLGDMGFPDVTEAYKRMWKIRSEEWKKGRL
ncbi:kinase-like domain-containing protein [Hypoxylon rubiginosum]|uniref:Kinase-like domain-containing protein n=1 Tax=Hypoxylon rubiginosum TaxID=110542 RepID=A0ACB9ZDL3_9PEZI|nr:kinase-like domain-containing protein [Hypoxylon rubiginosum]